MDKYYTVIIQTFRTIIRITKYLEFTIKCYEKKAQRTYYVV